MTTKQQILQMLENSSGYISGEELAHELGVSRNAVWKAINLLKNDGYEFDSITKKGYRLKKDCDMLSQSRISTMLDCNVNLEVLKSTESTNDLLYSRALSGVPNLTTIIAGAQTNGHGRFGRSFFSPDDSGLYMSILVRFKENPEEAVKLTTTAAVCVCRALEKTGTHGAGIKWVNDIFVGGKKVCGILTKAVYGMESGTIDFAVVGVGINVYEPDGGFPQDISETAGFICAEHSRDLRNRIAAAFINEFVKATENISAKSLTDEYRALSIVTGNKISVLKQDGAQSATAVEIDDECRLVVEYENGEKQTLSSGEISIKLTKVDDLG